MNTPNGKQRIRGDDKLSAICKSPTSVVMSVVSLPPLEPTSSVRFAPDMTHEFPCPNLTDEEKDSLWFTPEEYNLMKTSYYYIVKLMERNKNLLNDDEMCSRGLEAKTRNGGRQRRKRIDAAIDAVLYEQDKQLKQNCRSVKALADTYKQYTAQSSMIAFIAGKKDAKAVLEEETKVVENSDTT